MSQSTSGGSEATGSDHTSDPTMENDVPLPRIIRAMAVIERVGNAIPHPFWLFWILAAILGVASAIMAGLDVSVVSPSDGETVVVRSLLSGEGMAMALSTMIENFAAFPPMATIVAVIMGVAVAERSGFLSSLMRVSVSRVPTGWVVFAVAFAGTMAHVASAAAQVVDPGAFVSPLSNWYFNVASSVVPATVITVITKFVLAKRPDLDPDPDADLEDIGSLHLSDAERSGLRRALVALVLAMVVLAAIVIPEGSPLRGEDGGLAESPLLTGVGALVALLFGLVGIVYGHRVGTIEKPGDVPALMVQGIKQMAPVLVLFFAIAQFLAYFDWTHIGDAIAVRAAEALETSGIPVVVLFLFILVPMLMLIDVPAETTQALFRIADSGSTAITPMSPYFVMAPGFLQQYRKSAGIGTLASYTLPLAIGMTTVWTLLFLAWWALGVPLGPGAPVR